MKALRSLFGKRPVAHPFFAGGHPFAPTHRHRKGGEYRLLAKGIAEADRKPVVIYDDADGTIWVRALSEFEDGRFQPIAAEGK